MSRILIDVDGVVADFVDALLLKIRATLGREFTREQVTCFDIREALGLDRCEWLVVRDCIEAQGYCSKFMPYAGAIESVGRLAERHEVFFATTPWRESVTWVHDRDRWLERWFGKKLGRRVVHTQYKRLLEADILVDDKTENCLEWLGERKEGAVALLFDRPWNASDVLPAEQSVIRVRTWDDVERWVEQGGES